MTRLEMNGALPSTAYVGGDGARYALSGRYASRPVSGDHEVRLELWRFDLEMGTEVPGASRCVARIYCIVEVAEPGQAACFCDVWIERAADQPQLGDFLIGRALDVVRTRAGELAVNGVAKVDLGADAERPHRSYVYIRVPAGSRFAARDTGGLQPA